MLSYLVFCRKKKENSSPTHDIPIDPNEPTYCLCNQVALKFSSKIHCRLASLWNKLPWKAS